MQAGWGRGTWDLGAFGEPLFIDVDVTGLQITAGIGTAAVNAQAIATLPGVSAGLGVAAVQIDAEANAELTGISSSLGVASVQIDAEANVELTGITSTLGVSSVVIDAEADVELTGISSSLGIASVTVDGEANAEPAGQQITSALGTATTRTTNKFEIFSPPSNVEAELGSIIIIAKANVTLIGLQINAAVDDPLIWSLIDESQTPNWEEVAA